MQSPNVEANAGPQEHGEWLDNAFVTLLADAVEHAYLAKTLNSPGSVGRLTRSSLICSALSVESAANSCLAHMPVSSPFITRMAEKFSTLDKLEFFLTMTKEPGLFDRGCLTVQRVDDLIKLRNDFVHSKVTRLPVQFSRNGDAPKATVSCGTYNHLKIDKSYRIWNGDSAITAVQCVFEFFDKFFFEWCDWEPEKTANVLSSALSGKGSRIVSVMPGDVELIGKAGNLWKVPTRWIKFGGKKLPPDDPATESVNEKSGGSGEGK